MRGGHVTQHHLLGDAAINDANQTNRHNEGLAATFTALRCAAPINNPVRLGDKGDGTPSSKEEARRRQAHLSTTATSRISTAPARPTSSTSGSATPRSR